MTPTVTGATGAMGSTGVSSDLRRCGAALVALAGGAFALHQILFGWHWFALMLATAALVLTLGVVGRALRAPAAVVVLVQLTAVVLLTTLLFARSAAVLGVLPGHAAWSSIVETIQSGTDAIDHYAPPAPAISGIALLLVLGAGGAAVVTDVFVSRGAPALAGLVVLTLQGVTAFCLPAGVDALSFLVGGAGWLSLLLVAGRLRGTGAARPTNAPPAPGPARSPAAEPATVGQAMLGRRTALASLGLAALAPVALPGLSSGRLTTIFSTGDGGGAGGAGGGTLLTVRSPLVELRRNLVRPQDVEVLRYGSADTTGEYLRLATLDLFDGLRWTARRGQARQRTDIGIGAAEGLTAAIPRTAQTIGFTVADGLSSTYLPVPYPVTEVHADGGWWADPAGLDVLSYSWQATGGFHYTVRALDLDFQPAALRGAGAAPSAVQARDLALPPLPAVVARTLRTVVAAADNDFDRAVALQEWFRSAFTYDISIVDASDTGALVRFLASRRGYCEQFAATMAVMARLLGIPSRVVVGFLPGAQPTGEQWVVTAHQAHAWPELYFQGSGWVRFEPTPAVQTGSEPDWTAGTSGVGSGGSTQPLFPGQLAHKPLPAVAGGPAPAPASAAAVAGPHRAPHTGVVLGVGGLAAAAVLAPAATARVLRERRWRATGGRHGPGEPPDGAADGGRLGGRGDGPEVVTGGRTDGGTGSAGSTAAGRPGHRGRSAPVSGSALAQATAAAAHADLVDAAWDHAQAPPPAATARQLGDRLIPALAGHREAVAATARLVAVVERARFAPADSPMPGLSPAAVRADSDLVRRVLARRSPWWRRAARTVLPAMWRRRLGAGRPTVTPTALPDTALTAAATARRQRPTPQPATTPGR